MPTVVTRASYLEVNSVPLATPAWWITNLETELKQRNTYGENLRIDRAPGKRILPHFLDEVVMQFQLVVRSNVDKDGAATSGRVHGFNVNADYLLSNIAPAGQYTATYHDADGSTTKTATVTVTGWTFDDLGTHRDALAVLELKVAAGKFA